MTPRSRADLTGLTLVDRTGTSQMLTCLISWLEPNQMTCALDGLWLSFVVVLQCVWRCIVWSYTCGTCFNCRLQNYWPTMCRYAVMLRFMHVLWIWHLVCTNIDGIIQFHWRRKQIESGGTNSSTVLKKICRHFFAVPPPFEGHCTHEGGPKLYRCRFIVCANDCYDFRRSAAITDLFLLYY